MRLVSFIPALLATISLAIAAIPPTRFIIVFEKGFDTPPTLVAATESKLKALGFDIVYRYNTVLNGFAIAPSPALIADSSKYQSQDQLVAAIQALNDKSFPFFIEKDQAAGINH